MRRPVVAGLAVVMLAGLVAAPAGAQDGAGLLDLPRLGFEIDHAQGYPGDVIGAQVDPLATAEQCLSFEEFGVELSGFADAVDEYGIEVITTDRPFPGGMSEDEFVDAVMPIVFLSLIGAGDPGIGEQVWNNLFVVTFVEPATTEMVGPMGGFDPLSGEGSIVVPELDPSLYAVAAACVGFMSAEELLPEGGALDQAVIAVNEWITANYPDGPPPLGLPPSDELVDFFEGAAQQWLPLVIDPLAIGIDFYCILQPDGFCATPPSPVGLLDDEIMDVFNGADPATSGPETILADEELDAEVVDATPAFTG